MEDRQSNLLLSCLKAIWVVVSIVFVLAVICNLLADLAGPIYFVDFISAEYKALVHSNFVDLFSALDVTLPTFFYDLITFVSFSIVIILNVREVRVMLIMKAAMKSFVFIRKAVSMVGQGFSLLIIAAVIIRLALEFLN